MVWTGIWLALVTLILLASIGVVVRALAEPSESTLQEQMQGWGVVVSLLWLLVVATLESFLLMRWRRLYLTVMNHYSAAEVHRRRTVFSVVASGLIAAAVVLGVAYGFWGPGSRNWEQAAQRAGQAQQTRQVRRMQPADSREPPIQEPQPGVSPIPAGDRGSAPPPSPNPSPLGPVVLTWKGRPGTYARGELVNMGQTTIPSLRASSSAGRRVHWFSSHGQVDVSNSLPNGAHIGFMVRGQADASDLEFRDDSGRLVRVEQQLQPSSAPAAPGYRESFGYGTTRN